MSKEIITISVNGVLYENFTNVEILKTIESFAGEFLFKASNTRRQNFNFSTGDSVEIYIDDNKIMTGFVNGISGSYDDTYHELAISGRDRTQDLIDSSLKSSVDFKGQSVTLDTVIKKVLTINGLTNIKVINKVTGLTAFSKNELVSSEVGQNAFEFIERYCRLRQVLITTNKDGDIELVRAGTNKYNMLLMCANGDNKNNILRASLQDNDANRFNEYIVLSQASLISQLIDKDKPVKKGFTKDNNIRTTRVLVLNSELSGDIQTNSNRAKWESNIRRTKGFQYSCRIRGYYADKKLNELILPNNQITINDDMLGINATLLIKSCKYIKGLEGTFLDLDLVNKDSFTLQQEQDAIKAKFDKKDDVLSRLGLR
jgi:prophage tail gpP-like protein